MEIDGNTILFLSLPEFYEKEKSGIKSNTVRFLYDLDEVHDFNAFREKFNAGNDCFIIIENKKTGDCFKRKISDISQYVGLWLYIISWEHSDDNI